MLLAGDTLHQQCCQVPFASDSLYYMPDFAACCCAHRFGRRKPFLSAVGRLDKDTSGLLIMTDDGQLLHSIQSPAKGEEDRDTARSS